MNPAGNTTAALIIRTRTGVDGYGNDQLSEQVSYVPAVFAPGASSETTGGQDTVTAQPTLYLPAGIELGAVDAVIPQVLVDTTGSPVLGGDGKPQGDRYEIDGQPMAWPPSPFTGRTFPFPVEARLIRSTG